MAESTCCFGCCHVRTGAVVISVINMFICFIGMISVLQLLDFTKSSNMRYNKIDISSSRMHEDFIVFIQLSVAFLLFYTNLNLYKSTRIRNAQNISYWLWTISVFYIFFGLFTCYASMKYGGDSFLPIGIPLCIIIAYQIYVVKGFHDFEVEFLASSERNVVVQPTLHGPTYVALPNQTVQNAAFPVQSGPYVIQQVQQHLTQSPPYPQQTYQYQPQPPSQSHMGHPDQHAPQEYTNPPPYSPNYNMQEGSSVKQ